MAFTRTPLSVPVDINEQSIEVPNSGGARQSKFAPLGGFCSFIYEDAKTLLEMMKRGHNVSNNGQCLGYKISKNQYTWLSYGEVLRRSKNLASGLINIGMESGQKSFLGLYSQNCVEWILTEQACYNQSAVIVPLYDSLGPNACSFIINQAEIKVVVCDKEEKVLSLLEHIDETPHLKHIVLISPVKDTVKALVEKKGAKLHSFKEIEALGAKNPVLEKPPKPSDLATVCYTSGTTGDPKGVMLSHENIIIDASANLIQGAKYIPCKTDVMLSFLPLAHMLERLVETLVFMNGGSVGFFSGDITLLMEDMKALKPTIVVCVPRLLNKIYDKVQAKVNKSPLKKILFSIAMSMKKSEIQKFIIRNNSIWDRYVFKNVRCGMGGRVRLLICGSAPLSGNILTFIRCSLGCIVIEGYGQTECVAPCTVSLQGDFSVGHVGPPLPCCHVKLFDVPEMEYYSKNSQGEICVKGLNVFKGYFKDEQKTKETIDSDGWLHTGDIGMWLPNGTLKIIDRKKHIFKLAQGEYIAPEKIENIYLTSPYVSQIFVHGESLQSFLVAIVVPDSEVLMDWCKEKRIEGSFEVVCKNKAVKQLILDDMASFGNKAGLKSFEQVKDIYISSEMFTVDNGLLTPTFKTKRLSCKKNFMDMINSMYRLEV